jgi:hypothetical protein
LFWPKIWLDISYLPLETIQQKKQGQQFLDSSSLLSHPSGLIDLTKNGEIPETMLLFPGTIALIDLGNVLLLRRNIPPVSFKVDDGKDLIVLVLLSN